MTADKLWMDAEIATERKDFTRAESLYRQALAMDRDHVPSLIGLSTVLSRRGAHREAHAATLRAHAAKPQEPPLLYALAQRLRYFHEFQYLQDCLSHPRFPAEAPLQVVAKAVVMLSSIGAHQSAIGMAQHALARDPRHAASLYVRGNLHLFDGELDQADGCYEAALQADPQLLQSSWMLASVRTQTAESNHVDRLRRQLDQARPGGQGEAYVAFGLYKELHDLGQYDQAWQALARGCAVKRGTVRYSLAEDEALVDALMRTCTEDFVAGTSNVVQPATPIFIVGMHRSGTTLLERILAGHSDVGDAGETSTFDAQMQLATDHAVMGQPDTELVRRAGSIDYDEVARGYARQAAWLSGGKPFFTEKLPMNFWNVGFIARALPQARILHMVRDPVDTCFSNLRTLFAGVANYSYTQAELAGFYTQYRRLMDHWHSVLPGRVLDVAYSELVNHPEAVAARVSAHCGLPYQPVMVDVSRSTGRIATASAALARQGIRRDRGRAWAPYEAQLTPLRDALVPFYAPR